MSTDLDPTDAYDPEVSKDDSPQAMRLFTEDSEPDVPLDPNNPAFDRRQQAKGVDETYEREYNRRYVKEHGDHSGNEPLGEDGAPAA